ncbi:cytochrome oxidase c assembly domain-containing protein [Purpureocillium lilacinum]|uniref:Cytochrome oxidase c assembly domain-containing protein n=1 Tax=Purpureocillium lilacinum TaxID=33203 RepID=A0A179GMZ2_PURLI|nr:cytochrome oxidase c assembly domain-containing protein [Purpureocillium lilacinum]
MASRMGPRSVKDATRFTSTIPHATSKSAGGAATATPKPSPRIPGETPEQRVRRLRQAHIAAQKAQVSRADRVVDASRRFLDVAHRWTVGGIVVFTAVAGVVSIYSVWDMLRYNRARRAEWVEAQKQLEADSLSAARIAYLKGTATEEQIALVEEANREAEAQGIKLPPLLSPPEHRTHFEEHVQAAFKGGAEKKEGKGVFGIFSGLFGGKEASSDGSNTSSEAGTSAGSEALTQSIEAKAKDAWATEKENQRQGGSLDQLGLETASPGQPPSDKRGWWRW